MEEDREKLGENEGCLILALLIGMIIGGFIMSVTLVDSIETTRKIEPEIRLYIIDNKIDTTYLYKRTK
jgi:hypothetical protein